MIFEQIKDINKDSCSDEDANVLIALKQLPEDYKYFYLRQKQVDEEKHAVMFIADTDSKNLFESFLSLFKRSPQTLLPILKAVILSVDENTLKKSIAKTLLSEIFNRD